MTRLSDAARLTALAHPAATAGYFDPAYQYDLPHIAYSSNLIARDVTRGGARLMFDWPPQHGKSELCSHWTPVWFLAKWPWRRIILASYSTEYASRWGREVRDTLEEHGDELGVQLRKNVRAAHRWSTEQGGGMITAGLQGGITGQRGDLIVIDDPIKNAEEAASETIREKCWENYTKALRTRMSPSASIIIIMTRWHEDDLVGRLKRQAREQERERLRAAA